MPEILPGASGSTSREDGHNSNKEASGKQDKQHHHRRASFLPVAATLTSTLASALPRKEPKRTTGEVLRNTYKGSYSAFGTGPTNAVASTKYTRWTFFPKALALQFRKAGNVYFAVVILLMLLGKYTFLFDTSIAPWGQMLMLTIICAFNMLAEGFDDYARLRRDHATNSAETHVLSERICSFERRTWGSIQRGQIIKLYKGEVVPADIVILVSSHAFADPCVFVETSNIDGETYLKRAFTVPQLVKAVTGRDPDDTDGLDYLEEIKADPVSLVTTLKGSKMNYDAPSPSLTSMQGEIEVRGEVISFQARNMLFRGSVVRNVKWVIGIVLYTGKETKVLMADHGSVVKQSKAERSINRIIGTVLVFLVFLILLSELLFFVSPWVRMRELWYLRFSTEERISQFPTWLAQICQCLILYKNLLPILLYAVQEGLSQMQANVFICNDLNMYCPDKDRGAQCNTTSLAQEIGQVDWIFTDKTGTLTKNEMRLISFAVGKNSYGAENREAVAALEKHTSGVGARPLSAAEVTRQIFEKFLQSTESMRTADPEHLQEIEHFLRVLAVCHTVLIDPDNSVEVDIRAVRSIDGAEDATYERVDANGRADPTVRIRKAYAVPSKEDFVATERKSSSRFIDKASSLKSNSQTKWSSISEQVIYDAESPDEEALVSGAAALGVEFVATEGQNIVCLMCKQLGLPSHIFEKWQVLAVNPFTSKRKRMSIVVREPTGARRIMLFCKGADNQVLDVTTRFSGGMSLDAIQERLREYASGGLRTLVIAQRILDPTTLQDWLENHFSPAVNQIDNTVRQESMHDAACVIEQDLEYLGITCVEDRLQEAVPESISTLRKAGIPLWVITGDKVETAIDIGLSVNLIDDPEKAWYLTTKRVGSSTEEIHQEIRKLLQKNKAFSNYGGSKTLSQLNLLDTSAGSKSRSTTWSERFRETLGSVIGFGFLEAENKPRRSLTANMSSKALVVEGEILKHFLGEADQEKLQLDFLELAQRCGVVIACRASPAQKALLVKLVMDKVHPRPTTLAIGDGTNDVPMIQAASVGVGISGREGTHATSAADFSIARFQFLVPLLLVHGRLGYMRLGKATLLVFYGNIMFTWTSFLVGCFSMFSGTSAFSDLMLTLVNVFVAVPVFMLGFFDTDTMPVSDLMRKPELYAQGPENAYLNSRTADLFLLRGIVHALIAFPLIAYGRPESSLDGITTRFYVCLVFILTLRQGLSASVYTWPLVLSMIFNLGFVMMVSALVDVRAVSMALLFQQNARVSWNITWTIIFLIGLLDVIAPLAWYITRTLFLDDEGGKALLSPRSRLPQIFASVEDDQKDNMQHPNSQFTDPSEHTIQAKPSSSSSSSLSGSKHHAEKYVAVAPI